MVLLWALRALPGTRRRRRSPQGGSGAREDLDRRPRIAAIAQAVARMERSNRAGFDRGSTTRPLGLTQAPATGAACTREPFLRIVDLRAPEETSDQSHHLANPNRPH